MKKQQPSRSQTVTQSKLPAPRNLCKQQSPLFFLQRVIADYFSPMRRNLKESLLGNCWWPRNSPTTATTANCQFFVKFLQMNFGID